MDEVELKERLKRLQAIAADSMSDIFLTDTQVDWLTEALSPFIESSEQRAKLLTLSKLRSDYIKASLESRDTVDPVAFITERIKELKESGGGR